MAKTCIGLGLSMILSMYCLSCGNDEATILMASNSYADFCWSVASAQIRSSMFVQYYSQLK